MGKLLKLKVSLWKAKERHVYMCISDFWTGKSFLKDTCKLEEEMNKSEHIQIRIMKHTRNKLKSWVYQTIVCDSQGMNFHSQ